jgi:hypothetical protein
VPLILMTDVSTLIADLKNLPTKDNFKAPFANTGRGRSNLSRRRGSFLRRRSPVSFNRAFFVSCLSQMNAELDYYWLSDLGGVGT